jgi:glycosyltransferase involved in cell wall biosynthesis
MDLYIVIPCYNESEVIFETEKRLTEKYKNLIAQNIISKKSRIMFVDDGSSDGTWEIIEQMHNNNEFVAGLKLARNRGHQNALLAGLLTAKDYADAVISMDADLQDDIDAVDKFIEEYKSGAEIVYGVRAARKTDSFFKRNSAQLFYKLMEKMGVEIVYNHADYRLMSRRALEELANFREVNLFLRGIIPLIGFKTATVEYDRGKRFAGKSKYPLRKMLALALEGITSCSVKPLKLIVSFGLIISVVSFIFLLYIFIHALCGDPTYVTGWASTMVLISFFGGCQILAIGIVGEYVSKIYLETKARPRFTIERELIK